MKIDISRSDSYQQEVIRALGAKDILVSASAGAGKTRVLVTRILKLCVEDRIPLNKIIALTFTSAAAQEMKNRLAEEMYALKDQTDDPDDIRWIDEQIASLVTANITTIDSYCLNIIKKYYNVIGLDPSTPDHFLSEGQNELLQKKAFEKTIDDFCADGRSHEQILAVMEYFSLRSENDTDLYSVVCKMIDHAISDIDPSAWFERARNTYPVFTSLKQLPASHRSVFFAIFRDHVQNIAGMIEEMRQLLMYNEEPKITDGLLNEWTNYLNDCNRRLAEEDYEGFRTSLFSLAEVKVRKAKNAEIEKVRSNINDEIDAMLAAAWPLKVFAENSALHHQITETLVDTAEKTYQNLQDLKIENTCMYFSDIERYALSILDAQNERVALILHDSLEEIMVDEFQDTSILQDTIIRKIAREKRIFRVGDVKQSIYRFRQAKPELMRGLMDHPDTNPFNLRYNYRSNDQIVQFTNLLFQRIMNVPNTNDSYGERDIVGTNLPSQKKNTDVPHVHLILLGQDEPEYTKDGKLKPMLGSVAKSQKGGWISQKILAMIEESGNTLRFHDFAVLTRGHEDQKVLRREFDRYGIPYDIDAREGFFKSDLCHDILALSKLIMDPDDVLSLLTVITSPLYKMSDEEIALAKLRHKGSLCDAVYEEYPNIRNDLETFRSVLRNYDVQRYLYTVCTFQTSDGISFYDRLNSQDQANFDYLLDSVIHSDITELIDLIDVIESGSDEKSSEAITTGKDDDVVTVTTIHHSKGLQYKNVFLWGTGKNQFRDGTGKVMIDDELMLGIRDIDPQFRTVLPTIQRLSIEKKSNLEDIEEFNRLLYVAVTRAEDQLFIIDDEASAVAYRKQIDLPVLTGRHGITGLITAALNHDPGINENGLFEVTRLIYEDTAQARPSLAQSQPSLIDPNAFADIPLLKPLQTPSSMEYGDMAMPALSSEPSYGTAYGTMVHELAEKMPLDIEWSKENIQRYAGELSESGIDAIYEFGQSELFEKAKTMDIYREYPFYYEDKDARISGVMDFVAMNDQEILLIDFKTDRKTPEQIRKTYTTQLIAYKKALHHFFPDRKIEAYAYSFHNHCAIEIEES